MDILDLVKETGLDPKRKAACHGGEYCSPCPFCKDGDDRFLIWPKRCNKNGELHGGRFRCRVCEKKGDAIAFLTLQGFRYQDACAKLKLKPKQRSGTVEDRPVLKLSIVAEPPAAWSEKATAFVNWCNLQLLRNPQVMKKLESRGFTSESMQRFKLGYNPGEANGYGFKRNRQDWGLKTEFKENGDEKKLWLPVGFVIPTFADDGRVVRIKIRNTNYEKELALYEKKEEKPKWKPQKYIGVSGSKECPSIYGNQELGAALVLESEFDALLVQQFAADLVYCVALGGSTKPLDQKTDMLLRTTKVVFFCPDFDEAGASAWIKWKRLFPNIHRILTPEGKAPGDAYIAGVDLREWLIESIEEVNQK